MKNYVAEIIHFATGVLAGYHPCEYLDTLKRFIEGKTKLSVIIGTHPMPTNYITLHEKIGDWTDQHKNWLKQFNLMNRNESFKYDSSISSYTHQLQEELSKK